MGEAGGGVGVGGGEPPPIASLLSSLRKQGPITTSVSESAGWQPLAKTERPRRMGPRVRGDDDCP